MAHAETSCLGQMGAFPDRAKLARLVSEGRRPIHWLSLAHPVIVQIAESGSRGRLAAGFVRTDLSGPMSVERTNRAHIQVGGTLSFRVSLAKSVVALIPVATGNRTEWSPFDSVVPVMPFATSFGDRSLVAVCLCTDLVRLDLQIFPKRLAADSSGSPTVVMAIAEAFSSLLPVATGNCAGRSYLLAVLPVVKCAESPDGRRLVAGENLADGLHAAARKFRVFMSDSLAFVWGYYAEDFQSVRFGYLLFSGVDSDWHRNLGQPLFWDS